MRVEHGVVTVLALLVASAATADRLSLRWQDINTRKVVRWEGDTAVVDPESQMNELTCNIFVNRDAVRNASESFGIPETWISISYHTDEELREKRNDLAKRAAKRGMVMDITKNEFRVNYDWVVQKSIHDIRDAARRIQSAARKSGYHKPRELVGAMASFVQELEYRLPGEFRINADGDRILTAGAMMPIQTLAEGWGDCDTKSLLFASLVRSLDLADVCFVAMQDHLFAAVRLRASPGDHVIRHNGSDWLLVELSDAWPLGHVPQDHLMTIRHGNYTLVELN